MDNRDKVGLARMSVTEQYWQQRCKKAERALEHTLDVSRRKSIWMEEAMDTLNYYVSDRDEMNDIDQRFAELARQGDCPGGSK